MSRFQYHLSLGSNFLVFQALVLRAAVVKSQIQVKSVSIVIVWFYSLKMDCCEKLNPLNAGWNAVNFKI
jgi:hypothetical protein